MRTKVIHVDFGYDPSTLPPKVQHHQDAEGWEIRDIIPLSRGDHQVTGAFVVLEQPSDAEFELFRMKLAEGAS